MKNLIVRIGLFLSVGLCVAPIARSAVTVDGLLDAAYAVPLTTQTTQTSYVDANPAFSPDPVRYADGSELDAAHGTIAGGVLHLFLAGDLGFCCPTMFSHQEQFDIFIDSATGGQNALRADNAIVGCCPGNSLNALAGLRFDPGFAPDYWLGCTVNMNCSYAELPTGGGGGGYALGYNYSGAPGTLSGGTNPYGILAAVNNSNGAGVTAGCAAASGSGVTTGVEWAIPLAAIGDPAGCVRVCVFVARGGGDALGNQVLGPLPPGSCALGAPAGVDFSAIPGDQFFTVCPGVTPTRAGTWGRMKTIYR
jgi:hypothetical protein